MRPVPALLLVASLTLATPTGCDAPGTPDPERTPTPTPHPAATPNAGTAPPPRARPRTPVPAAPNGDEAEANEEATRDGLAGAPDADATAGTLEGSGAPLVPVVDAPLFGRTYHFLARVFREPAHGPRPLGYLRRGARFRAGERVEGPGCPRGWHPLPEGGFVCDGEGFAVASSPPDEPLEVPTPPDESAPLPYRYARVARRTLEWQRLPGPEDLARVEAFRACADAAASPPTPPAAEPDPLPADAADAPGLPAVTPPPLEPGGPGPDAGVPDRSACVPPGARGVLEPGWFPSLDREVLTEDGVRFHRTVRGTFVADADVVPVDAPPARGLTLGPGRTLPVALVIRDGARAWARSADGGLRPLPDAPRGAALPLVGEEPNEGRLLARDGRLLRARDVAVARARPRPAAIPDDARWVHVDLAAQTLVAYAGDTAVFVTVVSTGRGAFPTPEGLFRVASKHVATTMDGDPGDPAEEAYRIDDVPWVLYFDRGYALHGAFWHDGFGRPRSHGCVNLAPADARWLFRWSTPALPAGWHGRLVDRGDEATWVLVTQDPA